MKTVVREVSETRWSPMNPIDDPKKSGDVDRVGNPLIAEE